MEDNMGKWRKRRRRSGELALPGGKILRRRPSPNQRLIVCLVPLSINGGLSRDKLYLLAKTEGSKLVWLHFAKKEKDMPRSIHISLDGRSGARNREFDFDLTPVPVSTRTSKGLLVTKWAIKEVQINDLALK